MFFFTLLFILSYQIATCFPTGPTENYPYSETLEDGKYIVYWKYNDTHITFETHVKTLGWIGFGLSENGNMFPADVVVGWVKNGIANIEDRYASQKSTPEKDTKQDWHLVQGKEVDKTTILIFERKLITCDDKDRPITKDLVHIIFAWNDNDPGQNLMKHQWKGTKAFYLIDPVSQRVTHSPGAKAFLISSLKAKLPPRKTYYECTAYVFPQLDTKHQAIGFEPVLQPGNKAFVHHFIIRACSKPFANSKNGTAYECFVNQPHEFASCYKVFAAWASGGKADYFPDDTGIVIGEPQSSMYFIFEVHYNNDLSQEGIIDSSGMRVIYTSNLRKYDAGILQVGAQVGPMQAVPPHYEAFVSRGACSEDCIRKGIGSDANEFYIFGVILHSHLLGIKLRLRHIRDREELEPVSKDDSYDFDFQQPRSLRNHRAVKAGDALIMECVYDSSKKTEVTRGGLGTDEEMCLAFIYYYPKLSKLGTCESYPTYNDSHVWRESFAYSINLMKSKDWNNALDRFEFQCLADQSLQFYQCRGDGLEEYSFAPPIKIDKRYKPVSNCTGVFVDDGSEFDEKFCPKVSSAAVNHVNMSMIAALFLSFCLEI